MPRMAHVDERGRHAPAQSHVAKSMRGRIDRDYSVVSGAVASKRGHGRKRQVDIDPHIPRKFDRFLAVHERTEADRMAKGMPYKQAHIIATAAEKRAVERSGGDWKRYTEEMDGLLSHIEHEHVCKAPRDVHVNPRKAIRNGR